MREIGWRDFKLLGWKEIKRKTFVYSLYIVYVFLINKNNVMLLQNKSNVMLLTNTQSHCKHGVLVNLYYTLISHSPTFHLYYILLLEMVILIMKMFTINLYHIFALEVLAWSLRNLILLGQFFIENEDRYLHTPCLRSFVSYTINHNKLLSSSYVSYKWQSLLYQLLILFSQFCYFRSIFKFYCVQLILRSNRSYIFELW